MTSPEGKDQIKCINCELYKKEIQEKDAKIKILENNLLKIKSLLSESGSLIDGYNEIMEENKQLKIEIDKLKKASKTKITIHKGPLIYEATFKTDLKLLEFYEINRILTKLK